MRPWPLLDSASGRPRPPEDIAILSHRIAASYLAEGMDAQAFQLASSVPNTSAAPQLEWDAGFAAYRLGHWADAAAHLEKLAQNGGVQGHAARPGRLLGGARPYAGGRSAAGGEPARRRRQGRTDLLRPDRRTHAGHGHPDRLFRSGAEPGRFHRPDDGARRRAAPWRCGRSAKTDIVGTELNRAFVDNNEALDPAMAALARDLGVTNIELRASEASVARGLLLTGLFPVPPYEPEGGYHIDNSLVLAFARIESRFQNGSTSVAGAHGIMQLMPATAKLLGGTGAADQLDDPVLFPVAGPALYRRNCSTVWTAICWSWAAPIMRDPGAAARWLHTKAGKDDPLLFVESIPVAETRSYVRRLMEYHWMYRRRFGQDATQPG